MSVSTSPYRINQTEKPYGIRIETRERAVPLAESFSRASTTVLQYQNGSIIQESCSIICEKEYQIFANGDHLVNLLCSQAALRELAYGFLYNEQIIDSLDDVGHCIIDKNTMMVSFELKTSVKKPPCLTVSSGFGGKVLLSSHAPVQQRINVPLGKQGSMDGGSASVHVSNVVEYVLEAMSTMSEHALEYAATRGTHCSALFADGRLLACYEDIGRHNTFDKLTGFCLLNGCFTPGALLTTTGRVSGEMMRKALQIGVGGVSSYSGATDVAIGLAQDAGILLVGYVAKSSAIVYSGID